MSVFVPRIYNADDVAQIPDLITAYDVMDQLQIDSGGVNTLPDAVSRIKLHFSQNSAQQIYNDQDRLLKEAVQDDLSNRQTLKLLLAEARKYLDSLPKQFMDDLRHVFPDVSKQMDDTVAQLQRNDCVIVVAGEKGSGKSSIINLIAGCKILPTDMVRGTRTICELRHSDVKRFVLYDWDQSVQPVVKECRQDKDTPHFLQELTYHVTCVHPQTQKSPHEKIDIFWPLPILGDGVVIVDSPGFGESRVSRQLEQYMARAFGFIYVINISNAGGIQKDRLGSLLRQAVERSEIGFDPSTALFVCNWWDQVSRGQYEQVLQGTLQKLERILPEVKREQVFPISAVEALRAVESGHVMDEYRALVQGIRSVLPSTFKAKLSSYYRWLSSVLKRSLYTLKIYSNMGRKQMAEKENDFHNIRNQIEALEREKGGQVEVMKEGLRREVDNIIRKLIQFLKSDQGLRELSSWSPGECPMLDKDQKKMAKEAGSRFAEKLASLVDVWECKSQLVSGVKTNIIKGFQRDLELFEDQIKKIEGVLFASEDKSIITDLHNSMRVQMPVKHVWKKAGKGNAPSADQRGCLSLGNAISACRNLDVKATHVKNILKSGAATMPLLMRDLSMAFLQQYKDEDLASAVKKFFDRIGKRFDAASRLLPEFLKADQHLLQTLQGDVREEHERLAGMYPKLIKTCTSLQGSLDMFYVQRLIIFDFSMRELKYDPSKSIGRGAFADVFACRLTSGDTAALKIQRDKLTVKNVTDVLLEDRTLRDIKHENIIRYYGAAREKQKTGDLRWVMVLEYCTRTLKQRFLAEESNVPGKQEIASLQMVAMVDVATFALQICSGLCYLHNKGIVHRDLKPDNILLTENDVVKLTDVGLAKPAVDITNTYTGTPAYMAPEILLQKGQYDMKADIYSLAIILWELWYGQDAADHIGHHLFGTLEDAIRKGLRPSVTMNHKPPDSWLKIMQTGWDLQPQNRPSSREIADFFDTFLRQQRQ